MSRIIVTTKKKVKIEIDTILLGKGDTLIGPVIYKKDKMYGVCFHFTGRPHEIGEGYTTSEDLGDIDFQIISTEVESLEVLKRSISYAIKEMKKGKKKCQE